MDAVKFLEEAKRLCRGYEKCEACPVYGDGYDDCRIDAVQDIDEEIAVNIVEKWAKEHPRKTNQDKFLEAFPETELKRGFIDICPRAVSKEYRSKSNEYGTCSLISLKHSCEQCEKEFWLSEAE